MMLVATKKREEEYCTMTENILNVANKYADGLSEVRERRSQWMAQHKEVRNRLKQIAEYLNQEARYQPGFFVDTNHAFNEDINGTCADLPSLTFRSGEMPMEISFRNASGGKKEYLEEGFRITFSPVITGQVVILLQPHYNTLSAEKPGYFNLAIIDAPLAMTPEFIDQVIARGMEIAYYSSFTGLADKQKKAMEETQVQHEHTPIGFKRYESTEKVK